MEASLPPAAAAYHQQPLIGSSPVAVTVPEIPYFDSLIDELWQIVEKSNSSVKLYLPDSIRGAFYLPTNTLSARDKEKQLKKQEREKRRMEFLCERASRDSGVISPRGNIEDMIPKPPEMQGRSKRILHKLVDPYRKDPKLRQALFSRVRENKKREQERLRGRRRYVTNVVENRKEAAVTKATAINAEVDSDAPATQQQKQEGIGNGDENENENVALEGLGDTSSSDDSNSDDGDVLTNLTGARIGTSSCTSNILSPRSLLTSSPVTPTSANLREKHRRASIRRASIAEEEEKNRENIAEQWHAKVSEIGNKKTTSLPDISRKLTWLKIIVAFNTVQSISHHVQIMRQQKIDQPIKWRLALILQRLYRRWKRQVAAQKKGILVRQVSNRRSSNNSMLTHLKKQIGKSDKASELYHARLEACDLITVFLRESSKELKTHVFAYIRKIKALQRFVRGHQRANQLRVEQMLRLLDVLLPVVSFHVQIVLAERGFDMKNVTPFELSKLKSLNNAIPSYKAIARRIADDMQTPAFHLLLRGMISRIKTSAFLFTAFSRAFSGLDYAIKKRVILEIVFQKRRIKLKRLMKSDIVVLNIPRFTVDDIRGFVRLETDPLTEYLQEYYDKSSTVEDTMQVVRTRDGKVCRPRKWGEVCLCLYMMIEPEDIITAFLDIGDMHIEHQRAQKKATQQQNHQYDLQHARDGMTMAMMMTEGEGADEAAAAAGRGDEEQDEEALELALSQSIQAVTASQARLTSGSGGQQVNDTHLPSFTTLLNSKEQQKKSRNASMFVDLSALHKMGSSSSRNIIDSASGSFRRGSSLVQPASPTASRPSAGTRRPSRRGSSLIARSNNQGGDGVGVASGKSSIRFESIK